ncbi:MAG: SAM-dependent chlorinase/fluorinase [Planctomycetes bacterium]|nr:SAM-dependent chlorinase/fluorinase [Planctomycetota bacterium]
MRIITLITDFGMRDHYAGVLKGVIWGITPNARIADITHEIGPGDILHGAYVLRQCWSWYPAGSIHVAIVDPGVGTDRGIIVGAYSGRFVVAPDNGLVTLIHGDMSAEALYAVQNARYSASTPSPTFHGRDIIAPIAAHLAAGVRPEEFGVAIAAPVMLPIALEAESVGADLRGSVLHVDRFGTLVTNIRHTQLAALSQGGAVVEVLVNDVAVGTIRSTFSDVPPGDPVAFIGSAGLLEIAINQGRAADRFAPADSAAVRVRRGV